MTRMALVLFAATVGLCQPPPVSAAKPDSVEQTVSPFLVAFANRDVPAFTDFIAEDATMFFPPTAPGAPPLRVQGTRKSEATTWAAWSNSAISPDTSAVVATAITERRAELKSEALILVEGSGCPDRFPTPDRAQS
jgi:hypothetical protein